MNCDDVPDIFYDVEVLLPVKIRYWATNPEAALEQFMDTDVSLTGPMHSFSVGFYEVPTPKPVQQVSTANGDSHD